MRTRYSFVLPAALALVSLAAAERSTTLRPDLRSARGITNWTLDGTGTWDVADGTLRLTGAGTPGGPIRRPAALAILKSAPLTRLTLEAEIKSTAPVGLPVRDVELVFGYESPSRFYYVHLAGITNAVHNGIFLVADADRRRLDQPDSVPQMKDQAWHHVRLERDPANGRIEIYMDGSSAPVLKATDTTITAGRVGFGSFDETGEFRKITVTGVTR
ncbi:MAG: hypothetical protein V7647_4045 [Acidobacteriota bacterium]|jgi:hypothetical protein